jgi:4-amino-4-deoxychorismate synthase (2-amino-4-deoxychorismate-forming) component I
MNSQCIHTKALDFIPDLLALHAAYPERYPHLLASNTKDHPQSKYDILFACPQKTFRKKLNISFLDELDKQWKQHRIESVTSDLPFTGGWFLYLGYELAGEIETGLNLPEAADGLPVAFATRIPAAIIIDHTKESAFIVCEKEHESCFEQISADLKKTCPTSNYKQSLSVNKIIEDDESIYFTQVEKIQNYIVEGDVFQVNLSRGWKTQIKSKINHASLYYHLAKSNPGPFNALVTLDNRSIISSSPERLIEVRDGIIETRPIAGTRPRADNNDADQGLSAELMAHPKEQAEHIMLIDLERNDLGRICKAGSVKVNELMVLETYQHVHHIVSNVKGTLKEEMTPGEIIKAVFPGGTITGCPKIRCMEILSELENSGRGAYTGSLGYLNLDGSMDLNILIRTIIRNNDELMFRAGGGIVADSDPEHELNETRAKAKGLLMALQ